MTELTKLADKDADLVAQHVDEVWVPGEAVRRIFIANGVSKAKLVVVPEPLDTCYFDPAAHEPLPLPLTASRPDWWQWCNRAVPNPAARFKYFSNFKWEPRKGWDVLFEAYDAAFQQSDDVSLYILTYFYANQQDIYSKIRKRAEWTSDSMKTNFTFRTMHHVELVLHELEQLLLESQHFRKKKVSLADLPHFCIITEMISEEDLVRLYRTMDAFVLPTRGEGWGLPTIQAMSMGLPTIATNWGGNTEFMTRDTSFLLPIDGLDELPHDSLYEWRAGKKWALPSVLALTDLLRYVRANPQHAAAVGRRAREHIVTHFSEEPVADLVDRRLEEIKRLVVQSRE
jgi:glycosyltransferase involved in cell wall biosynthesis